MWAGFFCRQDVSISIFGRTKEFSEVRGTSLMCNFGVRSRFLDVIYGVRPPNGSPVYNNRLMYESVCKKESAYGECILQGLAVYREGSAASNPVVLDLVK